MNTTIKEINNLKREILGIVGDTLKQTQISEAFDKFLEDLEENSGSVLTKKLQDITEKYKDMPSFPTPRIGDYPYTSPFTYPNGPTCEPYTSITSTNPKDWPTATFSSGLPTGTKEA